MSGSFGFDNIIIQSMEEGKLLKKEMPLTPSVGLAYGLPYRFEIGIRTYMFITLEGLLRYEITPKTFKYFDLSANLHYGVTPSFTYLKYGLTLSKEIYKFEPFVNYFYYQDVKEYFNGNNVIGFGLAIPIPHAKVILEMNYPHPTDDSSTGFIIYNIGIRSS